MSQVQIRNHRPGDMGYIIHRHEILYNWGGRFDAYVARIMADFVENYEPEAEACWIAERQGQFLGSVVLCKDKELEHAARLRVLLVEPQARGLGLGKQLVRKCVDFAREKGYHRIVLSTQSSLTPARRLYHAAGFEMLRNEEPGDFAPLGSRGEFWQLNL